MHTVNLARPEINSYIAENFAILQLNMWRSRTVTDFDGEELEERALARKWPVNFTPTICYFPTTIDPGQNASSGRDLEVMRMPGYFKPFHFVSMSEYVRQGAYENIAFQRYLQDKFERLKAEGNQPDVW